MTYIGHDIISLKDRANRRSFTNPKYIQKILSDKELLMFKQYPAVDFLAYLFWTCKESAYKIAIKKRHRKLFVPQFFEVSLSDPGNISLSNSASGTISYKNSIVFFRSEILAEYISTIACTSETFLHQINSSADIASPDEQSLIARARLKNDLSTSLGSDESLLKIFKNKNGIPYLKTGSKKRTTDISFSHDGNYYSYAYLIENKS